MTRWIRATVDMLDHEILSGPYDRRSAWMWLIAHAAWKDKRVGHKGRPLHLERGQVLAGRAFLAETWGWSEQNVRTFVHLLVAEGMVKIHQSGGHFANVLTICNYDKYQSPKDIDQPDDQPEPNQSLTSVQPVPNQTLTSNTISTKGTKKEETDADASECASAPLVVERGDDTVVGPSQSSRKPADALPIMQAFEAYIAAAGKHGLAQPRTLTPAMRKSIGARLREHTVGGWQDMLDALTASDFLRGHNERGWRADLHWLLKPDNFSKVVSGSYDNRSTEFAYVKSAPKHPILSALDDLSERLASVN